ncbi:MAG: hypothetical protein ACLPX7_23320 [Xanthobacteraceae bacterium]
MHQVQGRGRNVGRRSERRAGLLRAAIGAALAGVVVSSGASAVRAQTYGTDNGNVFDSMLRTIGVKHETDPEAAINYTERSPLVVPPTRDLPAPGTTAAVPTSDWPTDRAKRPKNNKAKQAVVPETAVQTPNPPVQKKPWYNPMGWFDKEEYANFAGEPVRRNLTDPPAGYRVPSPEQPYGIAPDKKPGKAAASASDFNLGSATPPASGTGH